MSAATVHTLRVAGSQQHSGHAGSAFIGPRPAAHAHHEQALTLGLETFGLADLALCLNPAPMERLGVFLRRRSTMKRCAAAQPGAVFTGRRFLPVSGRCGHVGTGPGVSSAGVFSCALGGDRLGLQLLFDHQADGFRPVVDATRPTPRVNPLLHRLAHHDRYALVLQLGFHASSPLVCLFAKYGTQAPVRQVRRLAQLAHILLLTSLQTKPSVVSTSTTSTRGFHMTNPYLVAPSFDAVPHKIDNIRWTWAGDLFRDLGQQAAAERCYGFAAEHRLVAATLRGERQIGDEDVAA